MLENDRKYSNWSIFINELMISAVEQRLVCGQTVKCCVQLGSTTTCYLGRFVARLEEMKLNLVTSHWVQITIIIDSVLSTCNCCTVNSLSDFSISFLYFYCFYLLSSIFYYLHCLSVIAVWSDWHPKFCQLVVKLAKFHRLTDWLVTGGILRCVTASNCVNLYECEGGAESTPPEV